MSKWKVTRPSVLVRGKITKAEIYWLDGDQNIHLVPEPEFGWTLTSENGQANADGKIECEVEILDRYEHDYLDAVRSMGGRPVAAYGVWVQDLAHPPKTELHPVDALVCRMPDAAALAEAIKDAGKRRQPPKDVRVVWVHRVVAGSDDSWVDHPPFSDVTRSTAVTIPFPPMPDLPAPGGLGWTPRWEPKFKVRAAVDIIDSLAVEPASATLTLRISAKSYTDGGPGALVMDVATFWTPTGRDEVA